MVPPVFTVANSSGGKSILLAGFGPKVAEPWSRKKNKNLSILRSLFVPLTTSRIPAAFPWRVSRGAYERVQSFPKREECETAVSREAPSTPRPRRPHDRTWTYPGLGFAPRGGFDGRRPPSLSRVSRAMSSCSDLHLLDLT